MIPTALSGVQTWRIGFAPILRHFLERCGVARIIDDYVPLDPRRKVLTHGQASVAMITGILFQVMQLYRLDRFALQTSTLQTIFPRIKAEEYFDDRLADTLDALFDAELGNLETLITQQMIESFQIRAELCHNDTTSASVYGHYELEREEGIHLTFGHSKKNRQDLKQLVWSLSVSSDSAFPLFQLAFDGNTADVNTYVKQWQNLIDLLARRDFLYVADSKLASKENMAFIHDHEGFFLAPLPMYKSYRTAFLQALEQHPEETLLPYKKQLNRGFEIPLQLKHEGRSYCFRMIVLFDQGLFTRKKHTLENSVAKTRKAFTDLSSKLNRRKLKSEQAIKLACDDILKECNSTELFDYTIRNHPIEVHKNARRGRPKSGGTAEKVTSTRDVFSVELRFLPEAFEQALDQAGYYPLVTNKPVEDFSLHDVMLAHKGQYKCEHTNRRAKSGYQLEPIYIHTPKRIEAFLFLFKIALQLVVIIERTARKNIQVRDRGLDGFMPNRKDVRNPRAENLLLEFQDVVMGEFSLPDGSTHGFVSELSATQRDILALLEVPPSGFSYAALMDSS